MSYQIKQKEVCRMKIKQICEDWIEFDNGNTITFDHDQDCCEHNFADFSQLEDIVTEVEFDSELIFEAVENSGFRFGSKNTPMFFIPCYSSQNGYYTTEIDIYYNNKIVLSFNAEFEGY